MSSSILAAAVDAAEPDINKLLGVILVCGIIAAYLFGMSSSQAYIYYDRFPHDPWAYKILVGVVWALDTFHTAVLSHTIYYYTVTKFGQFEPLRSKTVFSFNLEVIVVPIIALIVQSFFAWRVYTNNKKSWLLAAIIAVFGLVQLGFGFAYAVVTFTSLTGFDNLPHYTLVTSAWLGFGAAADLLVTASLIWTFWTNKTTFTEEDGAMTKILMYGVHTGLFTTILTFLDLIFVSALPHTLAFTGLNYILAKMYTNTMLYALNRRPQTDSQWDSGRSSSNRANSGGKLGPQTATLPSVAYNATFSTPPRIVPRDPYAPAEDYDQDGKPHSLTDDSSALGAGDRQDSDGKVVFRPDQNEVNYISMNKGETAEHAF